MKKTWKQYTDFWNKTDVYLEMINWKLYRIATNIDEHNIQNCYSVSETLQADTTWFILLKLTND